MDLIEVKEERLVQCTEREAKHFKHISKGFYVDVELSNWIRAKLPIPVTGFSVTDVDIVFYNWKTKRFMVIEKKCKMAEPKPAQHEFFRMLDNRLKQPLTDGWQFLRAHLLQFENTSFSNGKAFIDRREISEAEAIRFFSME